jgi:hypothetical protein
MTTNGSLVDLFKLVIAFHWTFDAKRVVRDFRDLGGELYAYWVPRRIGGANLTWLKTKIHACLKSGIQRLALSVWGLWFMVWGQGSRVKGLWFKF